MLDVISEMLASIADALFGDWYRRQSALTRALIWILIATLVLGLLYFLFPSVLGFVSNSR